MATARPSIVARMGAVADREMMPLSALMPVSPMPTPMSALRSGSPAAIMEPRVIVSTRKAISRPRASELFVVGWLTIPPPKATVTPWARAGLATSARSCFAVWVMLLAGTLKATVA